MKKISMNFILVCLIALSQDVISAPTNEQLYQMVKDLQADNARLRLKIENGGLKSNADVIKTNTHDTIKQLDDSSSKANIQPIFKNGFFASGGALYVTTNTSSENIEHDNDIGFQFLAGYQSNDSWDYSLKYKHFDAESTKAALAVGSSRQTHNSAYNTLDFEIGKNIQLSNNLTLRPSGGIRYLSMNESLITSSTSSANSFSNKIWGIGPRIAISPIWRPMGNNFRIFGTIGASFLKGNIKNDAAIASSFLRPSLSSKRFDSFISTIESGGGVGYSIKGNLIDIDMQAGYQFEQWLSSSGTDTFFNGYQGAFGTIGVYF